MIAMTPRPLSGKSAIVTGSTSGIGLGIASALAAEGCNIMLNGFGVLIGSLAAAGCFCTLLLGYVLLGGWQAVSGKGSWDGEAVVLQRPGEHPLLWKRLEFLHEQ